MILRDYQHRDRGRMSYSFRQGHRMVLYVAPTGSGKTVTFCDIAARAVQRGKRVCIIMHRGELIQQTSRALGDLHHGIIKSGVPPTRYAKVQVASVQTLVNRLDRYSFDLIIVDEAHHCNASTYRRVLAAYPDAYVLGFTATPCRTDGTGLADAGYTDLILGPDIDTLTEQGWLAPADVYSFPGVDISGVHTRGGDYVKSELAEVMTKPAVMGDVVHHYRKYADREPAIGFCPSVKSAEDYAERFQTAGYTAASIDGTMDDAQREMLLKGLADGSLNVLFSCDLISEGIDVPVVVAGIMLRPTQSRALWYQQIGRCLRTAPGKTKAVILDHAGNADKHGVPWGGDLCWTLKGRKRKPREKAEPVVSVRVCSECCRAHAPQPVCPFCDYVYPAKPREVNEIEGELMKIEAAYQRKQERRACKSLEDFERLAAERGYKRGWARIQWELRQRGKRGVKV